MPEYIKREAELMKLMQDGCSAKNLQSISDMPAADVAPVVRCQDCTKFEQKGKYYNGRPFGYCYHWDYEEGSSPNEVDGDDFCSYGERRDKP